MLSVFNVLGIGVRRVVHGKSKWKLVQELLEDVYIAARVLINISGVVGGSGVLGTHADT